MTEIGLVLLASDDPVTIQQFTHALEELFISPDVCREVPAAVGLLNRRKFDAVIVDLQLGEQAGLILDEARLSPSNRKTVTFAISGSDAEGTAFRKKTAFVFERPLSAKSIGNTLKPAYGLILRERRRYFRCPLSIPVVILRRAKPEVRCNSVNISEGGMALKHHRSAQHWRKGARSVHLAGSRSSISGRLDDLLVENRPYRTSFCVPFAGAQIRATGLAIAEAGRDASGNRCREVPESRRLPYTELGEWRAEIKVCGSNEISK